MKRTLIGTNFFFVDESGDPTFYNRKGRLIVGEEGCSLVLIMGFIETCNPFIIRRELEELRSDLLSDPYLAGIPSLEKTKISFHAKDDCPEVRQAVLKRIAEFDFKAQFVVARKIERIFKSRFGSDENKFYDFLITKLFENVQHRFSDNMIYFAVRGSKSRQEPIENAIRAAKGIFERKWRTKVTSTATLLAQSPSGEPCLQVIDYLNWAVYRAFMNAEMRFYNMIASKVSFLLDLYDEEKYPGNYYGKTNPFDCKKTSPIVARPL